MKQNRKQRKKVMCPTCKKNFSTAASLKVHQRLHTGERPCKCTEEGCTYSFAANASLVLHKRNHHTGDKPYRCTFTGCGTAFSSNTSLSRHALTHTGHKPYVCCKCGKSFAQQPHLAQHSRVHSREKPYKCRFNDCTKSFAYKSGLDVHLRVHTGEKPYICKQCGRAFGDSSTFRRHEKKVHKGKLPAVVIPTDNDGVYPPEVGPQGWENSQMNDHYIAPSASFTTKPTLVGPPVNAITCRELCIVPLESSSSPSRQPPFSLAASELLLGQRSEPGPLVTPTTPSSTLSLPPADTLLHQRDEGTTLTFHHSCHISEQMIPPTLNPFCGLPTTVAELPPVVVVPATPVLLTRDNVHWNCSAKVLDSSEVAEEVLW